MSTPQYFCITHKQPDWPLPEFLTVVGTGDYVPPKGIALSRLYPDLAHQNVHLGEFAALFALRRMLAGQDPESLIGLCHYRRFALTKSLGELRGFNCYAHPDLLARALPEHFYGDGKTIIIPSPVRFGGSILRQYAVEAIARDLLMYFGCAVDAGVITDQQAANFLSGDTFIPACTAALIPFGWFDDIVGKVEKASKLFLSTVHIEREGLQERNAGFGAERLHSLLLQQHIALRGDRPAVSTTMTMLDPEFGARN